MADNSKAAQLKEEGNKFFLQQDYIQAYIKYSDAIAEDATNAVLFANRAACNLAMKKCDVSEHHKFMLTFCLRAPDTRKQLKTLKWSELK
jgi:hypothetical protein